MRYTHFTFLARLLFFICDFFFDSFSLRLFAVHFHYLPEHIYVPLIELKLIHLVAICEVLLCECICVSKVMCRVVTTKLKMMMMATMLRAEKPFEILSHSLDERILLVSSCFSFDAFGRHSMEITQIFCSWIETIKRRNMNKKFHFYFNILSRDKWFHSFVCWFHLLLLLFDSLTSKWITGMILENYSKFSLSRNEYSISVKAILSRETEEKWVNIKMMKIWKFVFSFRCPKHDGLSSDQFNLLLVWNVLTNASPLLFEHEVKPCLTSACISDNEMRITARNLETMKYNTTICRAFAWLHIDEKIPMLNRNIRLMCCSEAIFGARQKWISPQSKTFFSPIDLLFCFKNFVLQ